jgi:Flp pilus assembly protein TadD
VTRDARLEGGPGWYVDRETLLPKIENERLFRAAHEGDPAVDILVALWTGHPEAAEAQIGLRLGQPDSLRWRALLADAWRDQGRTDEAIATYESLIREVAGTPHEAVMHQHLGKALFISGRHREAGRAFRRALELRVQAGAETSLIESSRMAVERAREAVHRTSDG